MVDLKSGNNLITFTLQDLPDLNHVFLVSNGGDNKKATGSTGNLNKGRTASSTGNVGIVE